MALVYILKRAFVEFHWNYLKSYNQAIVNIFPCFAQLCLVFCWVVLEVCLEFEIQREVFQ